MNERRSETPVADTRLRSEISVSVILQGLILLGIVGSVGLLWDISKTLVELSGAQQLLAQEQTTVRDIITEMRTDFMAHESRIRVLELDHAKGIP